MPEPLLGLVGCDVILEIDTRLWPRFEIEDFRRLFLDPSQYFRRQLVQALQLGAVGLTPGASCMTAQAQPRVPGAEVLELQE